MNRAQRRLFDGWSTRRRRLNPWMMNMAAYAHPPTSDAYFPQTVSFLKPSENSRRCGTLTKGRLK